MTFLPPSAAARREMGLRLWWRAVAPAVSIRSAQRALGGVVGGGNRGVAQRVPECAFVLQQVGAQAARTGLERGGIFGIAKGCPFDPMALPLGGTSSPVAPSIPHNHDRGVADCWVRLRNFMSGEISNPRHPAEGSPTIVSESEPATVGTIVAKTRVQRSKPEGSEGTVMSSSEGS